MDKALFEIRQEILRRLRDSTTSPTFWTTDQIDQWINDACQDIARKTECLWDKKIYAPMPYNERNGLIADKTVSTNETYTIILTSDGDWECNGYTLTLDGGLVSWYEGDIENNQKFTLPDNAINLPATRVIYNEDTQLDFITFEKLNAQNEDWEDDNADEPEYWFQKDNQYFWAHPPIKDTGDRYTFSSEYGGISNIFDPNNTYTFSSEYGDITGIQDSNSNGDCYEFTSGNPTIHTENYGGISAIHTPKNNLSIHYIKEHPIMVNNTETPELHQMFYYTIILYVMSQAFRYKSERQNYTLAGVYENGYASSLAGLMEFIKVRPRGGQARLEGSCDD